MSDGDEEPETPTEEESEPAAEEEPETPTEEESEPAAEEEPTTEEEEPEQATEEEEPEQATEGAPAIDTEDADVEAIESHLDEAAAAIESAATEADLDAVEERLDSIGAAIEAADLPEPEDEEEEAPAEALDARLAELRDDLESQRGPYGSDVVEAIRDAQSTIDETEWTDQGVGELAAAVDAFLDSMGDALDTEFGSAAEDTDALGHELDAVAEAVEDAALDADEDADTLAALVEATDALAEGVDASQSWDDLSVREKLRAQGFYEPIEGSKHKDYPPEWSAVKSWAQADNVEMVLLALEKLGDAQQMERVCLDALKKMGNEGALDAMTQRAARRDTPAIEVIGAIGSEDGVEAIIDYTESESNPALQTAAIHALGQIGSEETTQAIADQLVAENESVRSQSARSLGLIGDTRAIAPLTDVLADTDESDSVRASAAWALVQISTRDALEAAAEYTDAASFIVQEEAKKAADALEADEAAAAA